MRTKKQERIFDNYAAAALQALIAKSPMKIEGKVYENAVVSNDKSKTITKWKARNITKTIIIEKKKETTRTDNTWLYLGLFLIAGCLVFLYFYLPKLKTVI